MTRKILTTGHKGKMFLQLRDEELRATMDKLMTLEKYSKSRNALLNDALAIGLPIVEKKALGSKKDGEKEQETTKKQSAALADYYDAFFKEVIELLEELTKSCVITRNVVCSLFNAKLSELPDESFFKRKFEDGSYSYVPDFTDQTAEDCEEPIADNR